MASLLEHLEENLTDDELNQEASCLNEFRDEDLAMYPAIEIKEVDLTAQQCETIANNVINAINLADGGSSGDKPVKALVALAYNSLMNPKQFSHKYSAQKKPLFQKEKYKLSEKWLRVCAKSDLDLTDYLNTNETTLGNPLKLTLIRPDASDFERKASIGAWAYYHLRLMGNFKGFFWSKYTSDRFSNIVLESYMFEVPYEFPAMSRISYDLLGDRLMVNKSGEVLYLLYRSMIILEKADCYNMTRQSRLLDQLVFGFPNGLGEGRLRLWNWTKTAAAKKNLNVPIEGLLNELECAIDELDDEDPRYVKFTSCSRINLDNLREFYRKYIKKPALGDNLMKSRYFKYARLVNNNYFYCLKILSTRELICALIYIVEKTSHREIKIKPSRPPWKRWGDEMGARICRKHPISSRPNNLVNRFGRISLYGNNRRSQPASCRPIQLRPVSLRQPTPPVAPSTSVGPECSICLTSFSTRSREGHKIVVVECGHIYCEPCIKASIAAQGYDSNCPFCRRHISQNFIEIYEFS